MSQDAGGIGSANSNPLGTPDLFIDGGKRTVGHGARLSDSPAVTQAPTSQNRVDISLSIPRPAAMTRPTLAVGPTALIAALRPSFRVAPITAVIVLVGAPPGAGLLTAIHRVMEITLGCVIGALTAHLVLPDRARAAIITGAAGVLDALGKVAAAHLTGADSAHIDGLNELVRRHLSAVAIAAAEEARERALFLRIGQSAAPLVRTVGPRLKSHNLSPLEMSLCAKQT